MKNILLKTNMYKFCNPQGNEQNMKYFSLNDNSIFLYHIHPDLLNNDSEYVYNCIQYGEYCFDNFKKTMNENILDLNDKLDKLIIENNCDVVFQ